MRLIDADALIKGFDLCIDTADDTASVLIATTFKRIVNKQPTIEPKKGRWIEYDNSHCECPFCHKEWSYFDNDVEYFNYCPSCGADMREGADG